MIYFWYINIEQVVNVFIEDNIIQKLEGNKMKSNFLFNNYFSDQLLTRKIYIIIQPPTITGKCLLMIYLLNKNSFFIDLSL